MNQPLFQTLQLILREGESLNFKVQATADGQLNVLVTPVMGKEFTAKDETAQQVRAALALPLRLTMSAENLDEGIIDKLTRYADQRNETGDAFDTLMDSLKEATKSAKSKSGSATPAKKKVTKKKVSAKVKKPTQAGKAADKNDEKSDDAESATAVPATQAASSDNLFDMEEAS